MILFSTPGIDPLDPIDPRIGPRIVNVLMTNFWGRGICGLGVSRGTVWYVWYVVCVVCVWVYGTFGVWNYATMGSLGGSLGGSALREVHWQLCRAEGRLVPRQTKIQPDRDQQH